MCICICVKVVGQENHCDGLNELTTCLWPVIVCVCVNANARGRPCVITIISFSWKMNRSLLRMRCLNVWDVLSRESPAMHVAHLKSAPYYVFMKEQQDWQFIIHWTRWEEFTFCCRRGVSEVKVRAEIHCKTSSSVHRFISCSKKGSNCISASFH